MKEVKSLGRFGNVHVKMGWMMNGRLRRACEFYLNLEFNPQQLVGMKFFISTFFGGNIAIKLMRFRESIKPP
jgi:hypothetical protein